MSLRLILSLLVLNLGAIGCTGPRLYAEVGLAYQLDGISDQILDTKQPWTGSNPFAHVEVGVEWQEGLSCGMHHWSSLRDGSPWGNSNPELYSNDLRCTKRWGGH